MSDSAALPVPAGIRMHHLHRFCVATVQPERIAILDERLGRIQPDNLLQAKVEVVGNITANVRAQGVAHACCAVDPQPGVAQKRQRLSDAIGDWPQIVDGRHVTGRSGERAPVHDKHIVAAVVQVGYINGRRNTEEVLKAFARRSNPL